MSEKYTQTDVNRRGFLKAAVVAAAAAAATGSTAGLLLKGKSQPAVPVLTMPKVDPPLGAQIPNPDLTSLQAQLVSTQAENNRLQIRLSSVQSQLDLANNPASVQEPIDLEAWQSQLDEANLQNVDLMEDISILRGLVELYEQIDAIDLAALAGDGLAAVDGILGEMIDELPSVNEGIEAGQKALDEFEEQIPGIKEGRQWLSGQIGVLGDSYQQIELALANAVKGAGSFLQQFNKWIQDVLKWLPFGIGDKAAAILDALARLLAEIPDTFDGLQTNIGAPLDVWLEDDGGGEMRLQRRLIKPVREIALDKASGTLSKVETMQTVYQSQLAEPVTNAAENQRVIRERINEYRQTYQV
jgi:hypothetical protein